MMNEYRFEIICTVLLGLGQMCIMTGFDASAFIAESVLHSVSSREPWRIDGFAGYYGQAICFATYMTMSIFAPAVMEKLTPKWTLFVASLCYSLYHMGFFFLNSYYYYASCAVMGAGFSLFYTGHGGYLTAHSSRRTIERNSALGWGIGSICMLLGGGILASIFTFNNSSRGATAVNSTTITQNRNSTPISETHHKYRTFSDVEINYIYSAFLTVTIAANVLFAFIPSGEIHDCIEGRENSSKKGLRKHMKLMLSAFTNKKMLLLTPLFLHHGFYNAFWVCVYPTTLHFTQELSQHVYLPAMYSVAGGFGEILMGMFISFMSKRVKNFTMRPTYYMCLVLSILQFTLMALSIPEKATYQPTDEVPLLIAPRFWLSTLIAFLIGLADCCVNMTRTVTCALAMPNHRIQSYSISKFYQALGGAILMFCSPFLTIYHYIAIMTTTVIVSTVSFNIVARQTAKMERRANEDETKVEESVDKKIYETLENTYTNDGFDRDCSKSNSSSIHSKF